MTVSLAAGGAFVTVYIPHLLAVGSKVIGFMPGYLKEDGYTSGTEFGIIGLFLTAAARPSPRPSSCWPWSGWPCCCSPTRTSPGAVPW